MIIPSSPSKEKWGCHLHLQKSSGDVTHTWEATSTFLWYIYIYHNIILDFIVLYFTVLYYTILYLTLLWYNRLYYTLLCYTMPYYSLLCSKFRERRDDATSTWRGMREVSMPPHLQKRIGNVTLTWDATSTFLGYILYHTLLCIIL